MVNKTSKDNTSATSARHYKPLDQWVVALDRTVRALAPHQAKRPSPAVDIQEPNLDDQQKKHAAGLMRINHSGEVCAQALYLGQAVGTKDAALKKQLRQAASEEADHLAWCDERLKQLDSRGSRLDLVWYGLSLGIGMAASVMGRGVNLGFLAATEEQVGRHLREHLKQLPANDQKSRVIVETMIKEEEAHAEKALEAGGIAFSRTIGKAMYRVSRLMAFCSYRI